MSFEIKALLIGGLLPAVLYGVTGVFQKLSAKAEGGPAMYLICLGAGTVLVGLILQVILPEQALSFRSASFALAAGLSFALGAGLISLALLRYQAAIAQLSPLYNMNVLVTVVIGLALFAEYQNVDVPRLVGGTVLIIAGGLLVAGS
jgi:transporter family protein